MTLAFIGLSRELALASMNPCVISFLECVITLNVGLLNSANFLIDFHGTLLHFSGSLLRYFESLGWIDSVMRNFTLELLKIDYSFSLFRRAEGQLHPEYSMFCCKLSVSHLNFVRWPIVIRHNFYIK